MERDVLRNQVSEASRHETRSNNTLAILNSNVQDDEHPLIDTNHSYGDASTNQRFISDNILTCASRNANNNSMDDSPQNKIMALILKTKLAQ